MNRVQDEGARGEGGNPVELLERVFAHIAQTRMSDVPILNPAMRVEAVGFREWEGRWAGVLVTPWMINLVLLPGPDKPLCPLAPDENATWHFPSGSYDFMGLNEAELGTCHMCPLISPVAEFATHEDALAVAQQIILALFGSIDDSLAAKREAASVKGESIGEQGLSRRNFFALLGGN
ncbi:MAG: [NiFe]-hydrogenase assembly chaperone HybE [Gallionella sp.]|jgi:[NiFe] hydrogenase assembly HybE family chaperone